MKKFLFILSLFGLVLNLYAADQKKPIDSTMLRKTIISALKEYSSKPVDTLKTIPLPNLDSLVVTGTGSLESFLEWNRDPNLVVYGDYVYVELNNIKTLLKYQSAIKKPKTVDTASIIVLYINGNPMYDIPVVTIDHVKQRVLFLLDRHSKALMQFYPMFPYINSGMQVNLSVGFKNGVYVNLSQSGNITMKYMTNWPLWLTIIVIAVFLFLFINLARTSTLLRIGATEDTRYSLAFVQLTFWTLVIAMSFFYIWVSTQELFAITGSTLILLGISIATTVGAKLVDDVRAVPIQLIKKSEGFFTDILSDEDGVSVHRCQMVLWTIILGIIFIVNVVKDQQIPQIDSGLLGLMGISSLGYVGLKKYEAKP